MFNYIAHNLTRAAVLKLMNSFNQHLNFTALQECNTVQCTII